MITDVWNATPRPSPRGRKHIKAHRDQLGPDYAVKVVPKPPPPLTSMAPENKPPRIRNSRINLGRSIYEVDAINPCWQALTPRRKFLRTDDIDRSCNAFATFSALRGQAPHSARPAAKWCRNEDTVNPTSFAVTPRRFGPESERLKLPVSAIASASSTLAVVVPPLDLHALTMSLRENGTISLTQTMTTLRSPRFEAHSVRTTRGGGIGPGDESPQLKHLIAKLPTFSHVKSVYTRKAKSDNVHDAQKFFDREMLSADFCQHEIGNFDVRAITRGAQRSAATDV